jgi:hypothetical protein
MDSNTPQEYRAKVMEIGGMLRGWIPANIARQLKVREGDYIVFRIDAAGKVKVTMRRQTASEKKQSAARQTKKR